MDYKYYELAQALDEALQQALEAAYGSRTCNMRYRTQDLPRHIQDIALRYQNAMDMWIMSGRERVIESAQGELFSC